ncbi:hypothetical protein MXD62_12440 [Frankia sp. Mgl5]|uniref:hypothetical protein n=1 Tax=Frankia sp. Mgl5 TaxID=2933793 RepID=UPI00200F0147|nr:hypothetical protein [Frankia sp. Mgl5]MCK9927974.1 hypothetical protein [Frankia sp. Mgl5]
MPVRFHGDFDWPGVAIAGPAHTCSCPSQAGRTSSRRGHALSRRGPGEEPHHPHRRTSLRRYYGASSHPTLGPASHPRTTRHRLTAGPTSVAGRRRPPPRQR